MSSINKIYCGDNLEIMRTFPDEFVDLIYLDPPFSSDRQYGIIWGENAKFGSFDDTSAYFEKKNKELGNKITDEARAYYERHAGGMSHYLVWMIDRLKEMHRILKPTGSIYLHCDWHVGHYLKIEMDKIFGYDNFQNEIVWCYTVPVNSHNRFCRKHDSILFYTKGKEWTFNADDVRVPYGEWANGKTSYKTKSFGLTESTEVKLNNKGKLCPDYWLINIIGSNSEERLGYPTQKPKALLERIIRASSNKDDLVFDPFCGCGTTLEAADELGRHYIGIDISPIACSIMAERVSYSEREIIGLPITFEDLLDMEPHEFQQWVCYKMLARNTSKDPKKASGKDNGIDGIIKSENLETDKYGGSPIQVKQSGNIGVNVIRNFFAAMHDVKAKNGFIIALNFSPGAVEQVSKYKLEESVNIILIRASSLCDVPHYDFENISS